MANIARDGAPKRTQTDTPPHPGAVHIVNLGGVPVPIPGISRTEAQRLLGNDGGLNEVHGGGATTTVTLKAAHKGAEGAAPIHPSMRKLKPSQAATARPQRAE